MKSGLLHLSFFCSRHEGVVPLICCECCERRVEGGLHDGVVVEQHHVCFETHQAEVTGMTASRMWHSHFNWILPLLHRRQCYIVELRGNRSSGRLSWLVEAHSERRYQWRRLPFILSLLLKRITPGVKADASLRHLLSVIFSSSERMTPS